MGEMRRAIVMAGFLGLAVLPLMATASPDTPSQAAPPPRMSVAIAQPLAAIGDSGGLMALPAGTSDAMLPESGLLVLVGSALLGLAAVVRRTTQL